MRLQRASNNTAVALGRELGRGGEGAVHPVVGAPDLVAKIYLKPPSPVKVEKLRSMARRASPSLLRVAAWPVDLLTDEAGAVRGFLMPKVSAREDVHQLYSPRSRRRAFPAVDFRFVVRVAANIARAFAQVHAVGNVIGDVNHGNALVGRDGTVVLIDCDSFQVREAARIFTCDVGVPLFTAPELSGQAFRGMRRTADHDAFGLAVLLFHLLFLGRHPYAGKHVDGEMPIERAIAESRFVYGANAAAFGMVAPPGTLALDAFGADIAALFERAFAPPGASPRPTAMQWIEALHALESQLSGCPVSASHYYLAAPRRPDGGASGCYWCALEHNMGLKLFGAQSATFDALGNAKLAPIWDSISAIARPPPAQLLSRVELPDFETESPDPLGRVPRIVLSWALVALGIGCLLYQPGAHVLPALASFAAAVALRWKRFKSDRNAHHVLEVQRAISAARERLTRAVEEWNRVCLDDRFEKLLMQLEITRDKLLELPKKRAVFLKALMDDAARLQKQRFLELYQIGKAKLPNVADWAIKRLAQYDIDSADDVLRHESEIHSLVSHAVGARELIAWAQACERNFKFDPTRGADPREVGDLDASLHAEQEKLLASLRKGGERLEELSAELIGRRTQSGQTLAAARRDFEAAAKMEKA